MFSLRILNTQNSIERKIMKKVLLLAAVAFGFNAMGQDAASARLMQAELPVSTAAKEKIEDIMLKRGGAVDDLYDYTDFLERDGYERPRRSRKGTRDACTPKLCAAIQRDVRRRKECSGLVGLGVHATRVN